MNIDDLQTLYDYNYWATRRIGSAAAQVSQEQFLTPTTNSYGSLQKALVHTLDTEYGWRMLCQHQTVTPDMELAAFPTFNLLQARWGEEEQAMRDYLTRACLQTGELEGLRPSKTSFLPAVSGFAAHRGKKKDFLGGLRPAKPPQTEFANTP